LRLAALDVGFQGTARYGDKSRDVGAPDANMDDRMHWADIRSDQRWRP
jgi:hypothetical protein